MADIDPDIQSQIDAALGAQRAAARPAQAAGADVDPDIAAQVHAQLLAPQSAAPAPAPTNVPSPNLPGATMQAAPDRGIMGKIDDIVRMTASGIPFADRFAAGMQTLTGTGLPNADYSKNLLNERLKDQALAQQYPTLAKVLPTVGGIAGTVATAPEAALAAPTALAKAAAGAGTGAVYGGLQGASNSPDLTSPQAAIDAAKGAGVGAVTGAAMPSVAGGITNATNAGVNLVNGGVQGVSRAAAKQLLPAVAADQPAATAAALGRLGPNAMLADTGPSMLGLAQGAVGNSPEARTTLTNALNNRGAGANARIQGVVDSSFGQAEDPQAVRDSILATRSKLDSQNYPAAFASAPPVDSTGVAASVAGLMQKTAPGTMANKALTNIKNMLMDEREVPLTGPSGNPVIGSDGAPVTTTKVFPRSDAEQLHGLKVELDNVINYDAPGLGVPAGALNNQQGVLKLIRGQLNDALETQVPGYKGANDVSSALAQRAEAVKAGTQALDSGKTAIRPQALADQFSTMEPGEQIAYGKGARSEVDRLLSTKANDLVAGKNIIKGDGDWNRDRLATIFGPTAADNVVNTVGQEGTFANTLNKVVEGSQTDLRNAARTAMKPGAATGGIPLINPNMTATGLAMTPIKAMGNALLNQFRPDPTRSYGEIARVLSAQGPQAQQYQSALADALQRRGGNAAMAKTIGDRSALAAALIGGRLGVNQLTAPTKGQ